MSTPDVQIAALALEAKMAAPPGAFSISSFIKRSGETVLLVHVLPRFGHLASRIPSELMGVKIECDVVDLPIMN